MRTYVFRLEREFMSHNWSIYALAVMAYLLRVLEPNSGWAGRIIELIDSFPESDYVTRQSIGVPENWSTMDLWNL